MVENNASVHPIGDSMYNFDTDHSWKKKSLVLNATPRANSYNLVQINPASGKKKFHIKEPLKPNDSALINETRSKIRDHSTVDANDRTTSVNSKARPQETPQPCVLPYPPHDFNISSGNNPEYVNVREMELQSVKVNECKSDFESDEYENQAVLEQLQESSTKCNVPTYINWKQ